MFDIYGPPTHAHTTAKNEPISMYVGDAQLSNHFFFIRKFDGTSLSKCQTSIFRNFFFIESYLL